MANALTVKKIAANVIQQLYKHDPNGTTATDVAWVDMKDAKGILIGLLRTVGTSALTFVISVSDASDGSTNKATLKTITPENAPDAAGDYVFGEALVDEMAQKGAEDGVDYRYLSATLTLATGTDEMAVVYTITPNAHNYSGMTSDVVAT